MIVKRQARSSTVIVISYPEPVSAEEVMMEEPGKSDTRLSQAGD
jgi:hypothetical protein